MKGDYNPSYIHNWESSRLFAPMTTNVFWIPRKAPELLGLNTNLELGIVLGLIMRDALAKSEVFIGWPIGTERMGLVGHYVYDHARMPTYGTLEQLCYAVMGKDIPIDTDGGQKNLALWATD